MAAQTNKTRNIQATMDQLVALIRSSDFASVLRIELKSENPTPTGVWYRFHHGVTFTSWGEKITITLTPIAPNMVNVNVLSECGMPTQIVDWGKNNQNVENIFEYIVQNLYKFPAQMQVPQTTAPTSPIQSGRFCARCGKPAAADAVFCMNCGAKLM